MSPPVCGASLGELAREDHGDDLTFRAGYFHGLVAALGRRGNGKGSAAPAATWALQELWRSNADSLCRMRSVFSLAARRTMAPEKRKCRGIAPVS